MGKFCEDRYDVARRKESLSLPFQLLLPCKPRAAEGVSYYNMLLQSHLLQIQRDEDELTFAKY